MLQSLASYLSTKNQIICMLFFTYIYDLVRAGFIESRKKQLEMVMNHKKDNSGSGRPQPPACGVPSVSGFGASRRSRSGQFNRLAHRDSVNFAYPIESTPTDISTYSHLDFTTFTERHSRVVPYRASLDHYLNQIDFPGHLNGRTGGIGFPNGFQMNPRLGGLQTQHDESTFSDRSAVWSLSSPSDASSVSSKRLEHHRSCSLFVVSQTERDQHPSQEACDSDATLNYNNECPLGEMHWLLRRYQHLSHFLVALSFIKYTLLLIFDNELFGSKRTYVCYLPGRTAILPQLSPVFSFMVLFYHAIYRLYLCVVRKTFNLDCFIFLSYDRKTIESKQKNELVKLGPCHDTMETSRLYAMDMFFFTKVQLKDKTRRVIYRVRSNRNVEHWIKIRRFSNRFILFAVGNMALWSIPLTIAIVKTVLSADNFNILYEPCDQIIKEHKSGDLRQLLYFLCDMIDSGWLLFDSSQALVWPFTSMVFCAQDLNISIDKLDEITNDIASRLKLTIDVANNEYLPQQIEAFKNCRLRRLFKSFEVEILTVQSEITRTLQQIGQVDEFMNKISAFCIFCWICSNLMVQIVSLNRNKLFILDTVIQFMQICGLIGLTSTFAYIAQVNTKTRRLYRTISNLIALDLNPKTKENWVGVLEYFNKMRPGYSLRLGPFTELTLANYIKGCSWLITGALIMVNLFKFKKNLHD